MLRSAPFIYSSWKRPHKNDILAWAVTEMDLEELRIPQKLLTDSAFRQFDAPDFFAYSLGCDNSILTSAFTVALIKLTLVKKTCLQLGSGCQFMPYTHFPQHWHPHENHHAETSFSPKGFLQNRYETARDWQIPQLRCQCAFDVKPPRMLTQGKIVLHRWKLQQQQKIPCSFYDTE